MSNDKATPRPWKVETNTYYDTASILGDFEGAHSFFVAHMFDGSGDKRNVANAELIVRAVNAHEALVEATEKILDRYENFIRGEDYGWVISDEIEQARAALKLAKGE